MDFFWWKGDFLLHGLGSHGMKITMKNLPFGMIYSSSHNHGSGEWVPARLVSSTIGSFSISMIMGGRVDDMFFLPLFPSIEHANPSFLGDHLGWSWGIDEGWELVENLDE